MANNKSEVLVKNSEFTIGDYMVGTDYEYFAVKYDQIISAIDFVEGTKSDPQSIGNDCCIQKDNILVEFNNPPVNNLEDWMKYFNYTKEFFNMVFNPITLLASSSEKVNPSILQHEEARTFGCEVSFSAYNNGEETKPMKPGNGDVLRTAGLHVHVGFKDEGFTDVDLNRLIKCFDYFLGLPSVIIDPDKIRRVRYGLAGEYRFKVRGDWNVIEYRSLGSYFLSNPLLIEFVYNQTVKVINAFNNGFEPPEDLNYIINNYDIDQAYCVISQSKDSSFIQEVSNLVTIVNQEQEINNLVTTAE